MNGRMKLDWAMPLRSAGTVRLALDVNLDQLSDEDRVAVLGLVEAFFGYLADETGPARPHLEQLTAVPR